MLVATYVVVGAGEGVSEDVVVEGVDVVLVGVSVDEVVVEELGGRVSDSPNDGARGEGVEATSEVDDDDSGGTDRLSVTVVETCSGGEMVLESGVLVVESVGNKLDVSCGDVVDSA